MPMVVSATAAGALAGIAAGAGAADGSPGSSTTAICAMCCLHLIAEKPRYGYELIKAIEEQVGGMYSPSPGVIYPTLTLLEELGYVRPEIAEGTRKLYSITEEGTAFLAANRALVDAILGRMAEVSRVYAGGPAPEIRRAMQNLEQALSIRLGKGPLDAAQVHAITEALDRVAGEIERSA